MSSPLTLAPAPPSQAAEEVRAQVRKFLAEELAAGTFTTHVDTWLSGVDPEFSRKLGERGWLGMTWPKQYGGHERSAMERYAVTEELLAAGAPVAAHWIADRQSGPNLLRYGTEAQRREILPRIAAGECYFVIGMSEPDSGSDLASIRTRAARNGDGDWVVNGAKVWTSNAHFSHYGIVLVRTSPADPANRHAGLSQLLVDLSLPGITINPIRILDGGHHFNEVVFEDVVVPGDMLLGEEGAGWHQVTAELAFERSGPERFLSTYPLLAEFAGAPATPGTRRSWPPSAGSRRGCWRCASSRCGSRRRWTAVSCPTSPRRWSRTWGRRSRPTSVDEIRRVVEVTVSLSRRTRWGGRWRGAAARAGLHAAGRDQRDPARDRGARAGAAMTTAERASQGAPATEERNEAGVERGVLR
jgi:hypothetical protein